MLFIMRPNIAAHRHDPMKRANNTSRIASVVLALAGLASTATAQCSSGWTQLLITGPAGRSGHVMAYDNTNARTLLFGGTVQGIKNQETWRFNGISWLLLSPPNRPSAREGSAMVFDKQYSRAVLFSGYSGLTGPGIIGGYENATWNYVSSSWSTARLTGPAPRAGHVMVYEQLPIGKTLLFGGSNRPNLSVPTTRLGDTWEWNATAATWTQINVAGPEPRDAAAMAYDTLRQRAVLFGGLSDALGVAGDTWEWDAAAQTWALIDIPGPPNRYGHTLVFDPNRDVSLLFGGTSSPGNDTWQYSGAAGGAWSKLITPTAPSSRFSHSMVYDTTAGRAVLFGGQSGFTYLGDTWAANFANWPVVLSRPLPLSVEAGCTATFSVTGNAPPLNAALSYQWQFNGVPLVDDDRITGSQTDTLTIALASDADVGSYNVVLSSNCGSTESTSAALNVELVTSIVGQPQNTTFCPAGSASFTVTLAAAAAPTYQWQWQPDPNDATLYPVADGDNIDPLTSLVAFTASGSQADTLIIASPAFAATPAFSCVITTPCTLLTSDAATLITCAADFDGSGGTPDAGDIDAFFIAWLAGDPTADTDCSGGTPDAGDIDVFFFVWLAGGC
jgi:hypothetical protein